MNRATSVIGLLAVVSLLLAGYGRSEDKKDEPKLELSKAEKKILDQTNKEREKEKLPPLSPNPLLFAAARAHSANMAKQGKLDHRLDGKSAEERIKATGYRSLIVGENIFMSEGDASDMVVPGWMTSKLHSANILHKTMTEIGIGVARNAKGEYYYTQVFSTPRK
jgi:uncharacterized protein YkwD